MKNIKQPLTIINANNLQEDERFLFDIIYDMSKDETNKLFTKGNYLIFWCDFKSLFSNKRKQTQEEFPLKALPWFIDTIEQQYWNYKPKATDKPGDVSELFELDGETIGINPVRHCCAENLPGYSFWNKNRKSHISDTTPQQRYIPKFMLEEGLLDEFKRISTDLGLKDYS